MIRYTIDLFILQMEREKKKSIASLKQNDKKKKKKNTVDIMYN